VTTMFPQLAPARDLSNATPFTDDLPPVARDSRVTVLVDLDAYTVGACGECDAEDVPAQWRVTYRKTEGGSVFFTDVCGRWCADRVIRDLLDLGLYARRVYDVTLHLPAEFRHDDELSHLASTRCEGLPGCDQAVAYVVEFESRGHAARRECACRDHVLELVDYAEKFGRFTPVTVQPLPVTTREQVAA